MNGIGTRILTVKLTDGRIVDLLGASLQDFFRGQLRNETDKSFEAREKEDGNTFQISIVEIAYPLGESQIE
jgi:hypothetical protein